MRTTKIVGFSIPPEVYENLEKLIKSKHKTKSEFFREMIDTYIRVTETPPVLNEKIEVHETDLAKILRAYWQIKSKSEMTILVIGLAIIVANGKVLIGARKHKDPWVENLTWVFPGGRFESLIFDKGMKKQVKKEAGIDVTVKNLVAARITPDSGFKPVQIVALYFHCEPAEFQKTKPGGDLKELKWVKPTDVFKYFTTSTCDEVTKFLTTLEKSS